MSDPLSEVATEDLPREPLVGLRRRHQAAFIFRQNNGDDDEMDNPVRRGAEVGIENPNRNDARNIGWNGPPQQDMNEDTARGNAGTNNRRAMEAGQESATPNRFSPLSGSIGIGMFRISRLYCFLSILLAMMAIILPPIPINKMQFQDVATILIDVNEGIEPKSRKIEKISGRRDAKKRTNDRDPIALDLKLWSWEEFITRAASLGFQNRYTETQSSTFTNDIYNIGKRGDKEWKRRQKVSKEDRKQDQTRSLLEKFYYLSSNQHPENTNRKNNEKSVQEVEPKYWIQRTSLLLEETTSEILNRVKGKDETQAEQKRKGSGKKGFKKYKKGAINENWQWIDPIFLEHSSFSTVFTHVADKILKSTIRLCIMTNFFLTVTYLLHSAVAVWFLSNSGAYTNASEMQQQRIGEGGVGIGSEWSFAPASGVTTARERMGGFLIFKLLLISAVLTPDALDLMILVTWFTLLGCLRSLDHLAHSTNMHLIAVGRPPKKGIVRLLLWVLFCDIIATGSCVALFHTAGYGMVLLLTCDCALLGTDVVSHILKYYHSVWENSHDNEIRRLEEQQLNLSRTNEDDTEYVYVTTQPRESGEDGSEHHSLAAPSFMNAAELRQESDSLALQMEDLEVAHTRRVSVLDTAIFTLDMTCHVLTVGHFIHIWALHGVQFTLIDGVLALHLHSAISAACAKLVRRRNIHKIARDLEGNFPNATEEELRQAAHDDDVCCICLGSMSKGSNVKKAKCGHMYHTNCLREVIERAQSLESAKCPLCRAPLVGDYHSSSDPLDNNNFIRQNNAAVAPRAGDRILDAQMEGEIDDDAVPVHQMEEEPLFRFSTEGILPAWVPMPALSFEVVRRPPVGGQQASQIQNQEFQMAADTLTQRIAPLDMDSLNQDDDNQEVPVENPPDPEQDIRLPFIQRVLLFTGLMPMSPEEEARALAQLVDMFPQYDRNDLARELQRRGSLEAVTEALLIGIVPGVPRFFE